MKALLRKELRENLKLAALGLIVFGLLLYFEYRDFASAMKDLALRSGYMRADLLQPLVAPLFWIETACFCAIFGAILGWLQIYHERQRDLWSFLVHRPISRTRIFLGKVAAGLGLYVLVAGLPLVSFFVWARTPGQVAAPFDWSMLLPILGFFLGGVVYYFAGMLTGLRQARWYASRGLALAAGILVTTASVNSLHFRTALLVILGAGVVLGLAAWGSFQTNGFFEGQPGPGRLALAGSLMLGGIVVAFVVGALAMLLFPRWVNPPSSWSSYLMTKDWTVCKSVRNEDGPSEIFDLNGKPLMDAKTGRPLEPAQFNRVACRNISLNVDFGERQRPQRSYVDSRRLFSSWRATTDTLWYYWSRSGRLVAYNMATRRPAGSLGPNGFAPDFCGGGDRFDYPAGDTPGPLRTLKTATAIYRVDLDSRALIQLFATTGDNPIVATQDVLSNDNDWDYTVVATRGSVCLLTPEGERMWERPYEPGYLDYNYITVSFLEPPRHFALWSCPSGKANRHAGWKLPIRVTWLAGHQSLKTVELPDLARRSAPPRTAEKVMSSLMPPSLVVVLPLFFEEPWPASLRGEYRQFLGLSLATAAGVCVPLGWWLGRRYSFGTGRQLGWGVFHLLTGVPGLLAFLSVQEWPAREPCPNCKGLRVVDREHCEHCGAEFPPPEQSGVEIFENAVSQTVAG